MSVDVNTNAIFAMRHVGEELQRLRIRAGLRQEDAAAKLNVSRYTISKIERGRAFPTDRQLRTLFGLYAANTDERAAIEAEISQGKSYGRAWWEEQRFRKLFQGDSYRYFYVEDAAERLSVHSGTYVPGLLQTPDYVDAIAAFGQKQESAERRDVFREARIRRQAVLNGKNPVVLDALCLESAVRAVVGGASVMREQLQHLVTMASRPNITLRIIPYSAGAPSVSSAAFTIVDFPGVDNSSVVSQEKLTGETLHDDPAEVRQVRRKFNDLASNALPRDGTIQFLQALEKEFR
ncbi:helix-turn-helix transcriptional regulator [Streptomyces sp. RFCAC02]|uniref:helix-turn-helix domain-containing protein n=1 Tax=Streptomyces sp. RFCAC02 TaxID=2499143 RepID=UPI00101EBDEB|nr:helix-turn-helix transcriptional regulator [Streptomyces sp. RFCAC02]